MHPTHPLVKRLIDLETLKTWSVIVTLLGDVKQDELSGAQIGAILGAVGIKPQAMRVALHRLKSDGWITSAKRGREAVYRLSRTAKAETDLASRDVYRQDVKHPGGWRFHLARDAEPPEGAVAITKDVCVLPAVMPWPGADALALDHTGDTLPDWVTAQLAPRALIANAAVLQEVLRDPDFAQIEAVRADANAVRLLVLHHWRRIALRPGTWAHIGLQPEGVLSQCHGVVTAFLNRSAPITL